MSIQQWQEHLILKPDRFHQELFDQIQYGHFKQAKEDLDTEYGIEHQVTTHNHKLLKQTHGYVSN